MEKESPTREHFVVDSRRVLDWVNIITCIHNNIVKGENFSAGFQFCALQDMLVDVMKDLEKQEKQEFDANKKRPNDSKEKAWENLESKI